MGDAVDAHSCHKPRVVGILTVDLEGDHELFPLGEEGRRVVPNGEERFEASKLDLGLSGGEAEAVLSGGPRGHHPELIEVLRDEAELFALLT